MDPAALETRLAEARARRAKVLSARSGGATTERPAPPQALPPDAPRPLVPDDDSGFAGRTVRRKRDDAKVDDASASLPPRSKPRHEAPGTPAQVLTLIHPQQSRPQPGPPAVGESDMDAAAPAASAGMPARRSGTMLFAFVALAVGAVIGLAGAALVPGLGGWQIVIVRPAEDGELESSVSTHEAIPGAAVRGSDVAAAGEGEVDAAAVVAEVPPTFGRLEVALTAAAPGGLAPPPQISAASSETTAEAAARPELPNPPERAGGGIPRIDPPGAPPRVRMPTLRAAAAPGRMPPPPKIVAVPSQATTDAAARPELGHPPERAGGGLPRIDEPGALPRVGIPTAAANGLPESRPGWSPADTVTPAALEPAWQVPVLEVPAIPSADRALATVPAPPSPPAVSEPALSSAARGASIVLHHPPDADGPAEAAQRALALAGAENVVMREVALSISSPNVRYYHEEDWQAAVEVADLLTAALEGDDAAARDFTGYEPAPDRGLIEIWIDGSAPVSARAAAPRAEAAEAARERLIRSIEERLRERLQ